jgi:hypothetical protein
VEVRGQMTGLGIGVFPYYQTPASLTLQGAPNGKSFHHLFRSQKILVLGTAKHQSMKVTSQRELNMFCGPCQSRKDPCGTLSTYS